MLSRLNAFRHWLLPSVCALCGAATPSAFHLCDDCLPTLPQLGDRCPHCAIPTSGGEVCGACLKNPPPFLTTYCAYRYAFPLDRLIQNLKYGKQLALTPTLSHLLLTGLSRNKRDDLPAPNAVVAMPLARERQVERGFNQASELARQLAKAHRIPQIYDALVRVKHTPKQSTLKWAERHRHMKNAFRCEPVAVKDRHILLVDDVMTSGATAKAAATALLKGGAQSVSLAVVARATGGR
jgi:ComF family protein